MGKTATQYDYQARAREFEVHDYVHPVGAGPMDIGRVSQVFPGIGMVQVEFPFGSRRYPVEDLEKIRKEDALVVPPMSDNVPGGPTVAPVSAGRPAELNEAGFLETPQVNKADSTVDPETTGPTNAPAASKAASDIPFDRFYKALDGIRKELKKAKSFNDLDLAAGHVPTYVRGGASKGFLPKSYTSKYNRLLKGGGIKGLEGIEASRQHWLSIVDDMEKSARSMERRSKKAMSVDELAEAFVKKGLYWAQADRNYRATKAELDSGKYTCPKCKEHQLKKAIYKMREGGRHRLYVCPGCTFIIKQDNIHSDHVAKTALDWKSVAKRLHDANKGKSQEDLHYRAYLRAIMDGKPAEYLAKKHKGAEKAKKDLVDETGKAPKKAASRSEMVSEILKRFPDDSKSGRGNEAELMLTGAVAKALKKSNYTPVKVANLSDAEIDTLHSTVTEG